MNTMKLAIPLLVALAYGPSQALAAPILGSDLAGFAVLGATPSVTNTGATTLVGSVGISPAASITGKSTLTVNGVSALSSTDVHEADALAGSAQTQLTTAITNLGLLGAGTTLPADLIGLTLSPGVYTVPAGTTNLSGAVTLDGQGNADAFWLFQMPSTLITSSGSAINLINIGAGAGVFWDVGSSATLGSSTSFEGNILASASITLDTGATIGCGRALASTGAVTMDTNTINALDCTGTGAVGSNGLSGSNLDFVADTGTGRSWVVVAAGENVGTIVSVPGKVLSVPEPGTLALFGFGLMGLALSQRRKLRLPT